MSKEEQVANSIFFQQQALTRIGRENACKCYLDGPLFNDSGVIKCQYCGKISIWINKIKSFIRSNISENE